jgi:hypothetical protein
MPGFGSNDKDNKAALDVLADIDYAIVVTTNDKSFGTESSQYKDFCVLERYSIPYYLILNCKDMVIADKWIPFSDINQGIMNEDLHLLEFHKPICHPFEEGKIPIVNLMWYWYAIREKDDKILTRNEIQNAVNTYELLSYPASEIKEASNFHLIQRIFDMDNRAYLELKKEIQALKDEICPVGTIQAFAFNKIPSGWIECDGRKLHKYEYKELFDAIGYTFSDKEDYFFCIPDLRGRFIRGWDKEGNLDESKRYFGSYQDDAIEDHRHYFNSNCLQLESSGEHGHTIRARKITFKAGLLDSIEALKWLIDSGDDSASSTKDGSHSHLIKKDGEPVGGLYNCRHNYETRPKNCALSYCIRVR